MSAVKEVDVDNQVAVVEPGVTLRDLDGALRGVGLRYPVYPGELSGSIGGNVNTNAGGMRAVRHGVTRHHVLGLELVLADATVVRTGGKVMKSSSGYDLTQLVVGSEGTLALVTEVTLKLSPDARVRRHAPRALRRRRRGHGRGPEAPRRWALALDPRVPRRRHDGRHLAGGRPSSSACPTR